MSDSGFVDAEVPGAERAVFAGAARLPSMERPEEFNRLALAFLGARARLAEGAR